MKRIFTTACCIAICLSLSNGTLIVGQVFAWVSMAQDRAAESSFNEAILAAIEGQELCGVCIVVRDQSDSSSDENAYAENVSVVKLSSLDRGDSGFVGLTDPPSRRSAYVYSRLDTPLCVFLELATPPPRFEAC